MILTRKVRFTRTSSGLHRRAIGARYAAPMQSIDRHGFLGGIRSFDLRGLQWCCQRRDARARLGAAARAISASADGWLYVLVPLGWFALAGQAALGFMRIAALAWLCERSLYLVLKNTCRRRRPSELLAGFRSLIVASDRFSFPSGHTSAAFLFSGLCVHQFGPLAALLLYPWALAVGASRVVLGVHFPTDIAAGALLGTGMLFLATGVLAG